MTHTRLLLASLCTALALSACATPPATLGSAPANLPVSLARALSAPAAAPTVVVTTGLDTPEVDPEPGVPTLAAYAAMARPEAYSVSSLPTGAVSFPAGFFWGAATAAHQIEGQQTNDWNAFEATPGTVKHGDTSDVGVDGYRRYDADFALAQGMGHNAHRMSLEWSRIEPQKGVWNHDAISHYHAVFKSMRSHGLTPMVTLHHFTNPRWVAAQGGWLNEQTASDFADFAAFAAKEYGAEVDTWMTINEPNVYAFQAYSGGIWPPQHHSNDEALQVMANMAKGHALAYHALHQFDTVSADGGQAAVVGFALHIAIFDAASWWNPIDQANAYFNDRVFNRAFLRAASSGRLSFSIPGAKSVTANFEPAKSSMDFVGINYYTRWRCKGGARIVTPGAPQTAMGWENYPAGMYRALKLANGYTHLPDGRKIPVMVTENGIDDPHGDQRNPYTVQHLQEVAHAIKDGVNVCGYLHWTLMDNFEWAEGYTPRFGLYSIDRAPGHDLARVPSSGVALFKRLTAANGLPADLVSQFGQH